MYSNMVMIALVFVILYLLVSFSKKKEKATEDLLAAKSEAKGLSFDLLAAKSEAKGLSFDLLAAKSEAKGLRQRESDFKRAYKISFQEMLDAGDAPNISHKYLKRIDNYINRLSAKRKEQVELAEVKPILYGVSELLPEELKNSKTLSEFLTSEKNLCDDVKLPLPMWANDKTSCQVLRVVDGDTFVISVDEKKYKIRVVGYDTPEVVSPKKSFEHWGFEATDAAEKIINNGHVFKVYLDKDGLSKDWYNDRYGRLLAHIEIDGRLLGEMMLEGGHAEVVSVFPIEEEVLKDYKIKEYKAKTENLGMWEGINKYKLKKKKEKEKRKYNLSDSLTLKEEGGFLKEIVADILQEMLGEFITKSKTSRVFHKEGCRYLSKITNLSDIKITEDNISSLDIRPCKVCNGDKLINELIS
jgi:micrococcal nuclease